MAKGKKEVLFKRGQTREGLPCLVPVDESGLRATGRLREDEYVWGIIRRSRNPLFHKKYMAMMRFAYHHLNESDTKRFRSFDMFRTQIKIELGHIELIQRKDGEVEIRPLSTSYDAMDQYEFEEFYGSTLGLILNKYLVGISQEDAVREIAAFDG